MSTFRFFSAGDPLPYAKLTSLNDMAGAPSMGEISVFSLSLITGLVASNSLTRFADAYDFEKSTITLASTTNANEICII